MFEDKNIDYQEVLHKCLWLANDYKLAQQTLSLARRKVSSFVVK